MTTTKPFTQSKSTYFSIILNTAIRKRWWMYGLFLIGGCVNLYLYLTSEKSTYLIWAVIGFGYLLFIYIYLYRFAYARDKQSFLAEKQLFFNDTTIRIEEADSGFGEFPFTRITRIIDKATYWMLYISKNQFLYIPKDIFYSETDFEKFEQSIYTANNE